MDDVKVWFVAGALFFFAAIVSLTSGHTNVGLLLSLAGVLSFATGAYHHKRREQGPPDTR